MEEEDGLSSYVFTSINGSVYTVYFNIKEYDSYITEYPNLFEKGFGFGFFQMTSPIEKNKTDERIFETIEAIICEFISQQGNDVVLLYHCDHSDNRQACRDKLFIGKFENSSSKENFKMDRYILNIPETNVKHFMGYITSKENPKIDIVQLEFDACSFNLMQDKITE